jgi:alpha-1,2-mannosyltransferase
MFIRSSVLTSAFGSETPTLGRVLEGGHGWFPGRRREPPADAKIASFPPRVSARIINPKPPGDMPEQVCRAPDGSQVWTFGLNNLPRTIIITLILGCLPLAIVLLGPKLIFWLGKTAGLYLTKKTAGRKAQILELTEKDQVEWEEEGKDRRNSDDWESVDAYAVGTAKNGEKGEEEWDGIVGFLHPFWYLYYRGLCGCAADENSNAGGGGERVLWAAIRATQKRWPKAKCIVYTGDHDVDKASILARVQVTIHHIC